MNKTVLSAVALVAAAALTSFSYIPGTRVKDLTTELRVNPQGIDCPVPRFSWKVVSDENGAVQTAYRIVVRLGDGKKVWDSGKVASDACVLVPYGGPALEPETD